MVSEQIQTEFIKVIRDHRKLIYKICHMYCSDKEQIYDIEQEILLQLWIAFPKYNPEFQYSTWIYRISLNTAITYYRKERKHTGNHVSIEKAIIQMANHDSDMELEKDILQLYKFINGFNELDKALLLLYLEDNSYETIAEILGGYFGDIDPHSGHTDPPRDFSKFKIST